MYLHIGGSTVVRGSSLIGIMDIENTSTSKKTKEFLVRVGPDAITVSQELPRSFIITKEKKEVKIYISPISSVTLLKRLEETQERNNRDAKRF